MPPKRILKKKKPTKKGKTAKRRAGVVVNVSVGAEKKGEMLMRNQPSPYATFTPLANLDQSIATVRAQANNQLMRTERELFERVNTLTQQAVERATMKGMVMPTPTQIIRGEMGVQTMEAGTEPRKGGRPPKSEVRYVSTPRGGRAETRPVSPLLEGESQVSPVEFERPRTQRGTLIQSRISELFKNA